MYLNLGKLKICLNSSVMYKFKYFPTVKFIKYFSPNKSFFIIFNIKFVVLH